MPFVSVVSEFSNQPSAAAAAAAASLDIQTLSFAETPFGYCVLQSWRSLEKMRKGKKNAQEKPKSASGGLGMRRVSR